MPFIFHFLKCYVFVFEFVREMGKFSLIPPGLNKLLRTVTVTRR